METKWVNKKLLDQWYVSVSKVKCLSDENLLSFPELLQVYDVIHTEMI